MLHCLFHLLIYTQQRWQNNDKPLLQFFLLSSEWLVDNENTDKSLDSILWWMIMVWWWFFLIEVLVVYINIPPISNNGLIFAQQSQYLCCSLVCNISFNLMKVMFKFLIGSKNNEIFFCKYREISESYQLYQHSYIYIIKTCKIKSSILKRK